MPKQPKPESQAETTETVPFEQAIAELEAIVKDMESERMPLDQLVDRYERGNRLLKTCQTRLAEAEQRIEIIAAGKNGKKGVSLEPFDPATAAAEEEKPTTTSKKQSHKETSAPDEANGDEEPPDEISLF